MLPALPADSAAPRRGVAAQDAAAGPSHKLLQQGPVTFWECKAKTTQASDRGELATLHPGDQLKLNFIVRNEGTKPCNYVVAARRRRARATAPTLPMGPCGAIGFEIDIEAHNQMVWPGVTTVQLSRPELSASWRPVATVVGSGTLGPDEARVASTSSGRPATTPWWWTATSPSPCRSKKH